MGCANSSQVVQNQYTKQSTKIRNKNKNINLRKKSIQQNNIVTQQLQYIDAKLSKQQIQFAISKLSTHQLFSSLSKTDLEAIVSQMISAQSQMDKYVFKQGDPGLCFFIIYKGKVDVTIDQKHVRTLQSGQCFGQLALLLKCSRTATVICKQKKCQFLIMKPEQYKAVIQKMKKQEYSRNLQAIQKVPLFCCLTNKQKFSLSNYVKQMSFNTNDVVFKAGDDAQLIYIVSSGQIEIQIQGKKNVIIHAGEIFGEASIQQNMKRSGTAIAKTNVCLSMISKTDIQCVLGSSIQNLVFYNTKKWALLRSKIFSQHEKQINSIITSFQTVFVKNNIVIDSKIFNGFIICLEGKINNQPDGFLFNQNGWINDSFKCDKLTKNGDGNIAFLSYAKAKTLLSNIQTHNLTVDTPRKSNKKRNTKSDILLTDFTLIKKLGEGQFGQVYLVKNTKYGDNLFALKCLNKQQLQKQEMMQAVAYQRNILQKTIFPFIVGYVKAFHTQKHIFLLMEYIHGRQMFDVIREVDTMSPSMTRYFIACLLISVQYLHAQNIIYRDLKPQNSVVDHRGKVYLIDLGTAKLLKKQQCYKTFTIIGTPHYMAPQVFQGNGYSFQGDLWSLGCILYQFLCYRVPYGEGLDDPYQIYSVVKKENLQFSSSLKDPDAKQLISTLLTKNPKTRSLLSFQKIKASKFFIGLDWNKLQNQQVQPPYVPKKFKQNRVESLRKLDGKNFLKTFYKQEGALPVLDWTQNFS